MRVLLTGAAGYVGAVARAVLEDEGYEVIGLDAVLYDGCDLGVPATPGRRARRRPRRRGGASRRLRRRRAPRGALERPGREPRPALTFAINHEATVRLAEVARARGVERFVFASSCSMYGASGSTSAIDESAPLAPLTAYAESKVRSEQSLGALANDDSPPSFFASPPPTAPLRACDSTSSSTTSWGGPWRRVRCGSRATACAWRPLIHVRTWRGLSVPL